MAVRFQKRRKYTRPGYKACGRMVYSDARKALAVARGVKRLLNVEIKNHDVQQTTVSITNVPIIVQLTNIPQGDTTITRDGAQCKMIGITMNYMIIVHASGIRTSVRVMLVLDKQTNQAIYVNTDLLDDTSGTDNITSPRNLNNLHRFTVLYDRVHALSQSTRVITVRKYFKKSVLLRFDASTPSIADLTQNSLSFVQFGTEGTNEPDITSFFRIRYVDN